MSRVTVFLARYIGLFSIAIAVGVLVRGSALMSATLGDAPLMLGYAIISLGLGIALVLVHNVWTGGALPIVVTLVGWLILAKGLVLLFAPGMVSAAVATMHHGASYYLYLVPSFVLGLYLAWSGFTAPPPAGR